MKKEIILIATTIALTFTGCASSEPVSNSEEVEQLKKEIESLQAENSDLKAQLDATVEETTASANGVQVSVGDTITTENTEITINKVELTYDVLPDDTSSLYTHYAADPGNVYLHLDVNVKNLAKQNLSCEDILSATADYNNGYTYTGYPVPEDSTTGFTYANITSINPLETLGVQYLFKCPQEVEESENPLFITIEPTSSGSSYILTVR